MTPIINSSFNKHIMSWEIIICRLLYPYESVMKEMCRHKILTGFQNQCTKKINPPPFKSMIYRKDEDFP